MVTSETKLARPALHLPQETSLIAYEFHTLLIEAMNQGWLIAYLGWYVDSPTSGSVWHRWGKDEQGRLGVSLIASVYALWVRGLLDIVFSPRAGGAPAVVLSCGVDPIPVLPPLEMDILALVGPGSGASARDIVERLALPSKKRGIGAWFFSGSPSKKEQGQSGWFARPSTWPREAPVYVQQALDLAKALVALQAGTDLAGRPEADELERDRRGEALHVIELEIFGALQSRL